MIGTVVGNFRVVEKLGEGGMGTVYRGIDQMVERNVAIKVLKADIANNPEVLERFRSEAIALARLNHAAVATLYSFFREGDQFFMVMEFVPGETLEKRILREGALQWKQATEILLWALDGVRHAHQMGILHRDLKPANIMITPDGRVKVTDFGIARVLNTARLTREARVVGTLEYLAPERALGRPADARSDLYSLGVVFYEMLTGRLPFQSDSDFALMKAQIEQMPVRPREIGVQLPTQIEAALMKALAKDPEDRYPDAAAFAADFREAVRATGVPLANVKPTRLAEEQQHPPQPRPKGRSMAAQASQLFHQKEARLAALVAVGLIAAGAVGTGIYKAMKPKPAPPPVVVDAPAGGLTASGGGSGAVVPIAPSVTIPSAPPQEAAPAAPPPDPTPTPSAPRPSQPKQQTPRQQPAAAAPSAALADAVRTAIEFTDAGSPGNGAGPVHYAGVLRALRAGSGTSELITPVVRARGVNFRATPDQLIEMRMSQASDDLLHAVANGFRGSAAAPATSTPTPSAPPPSPPPPVTHTAHVVNRLSDVRKLAVASTDEELNEALRKELRNELGTRVQLAPAGQSDAQLKVEVSDEKGNRVVGAAGRLFGVKSKRKAVVQIVDTQNRKVLWTAEAGDNKAVLGAFTDSAGRLASRIAKQLKEDWGK